MADPVISFVIERAGDLLIQKLVFLKDVRRQVERLKNDLVRMRCFLQDADQRQDQEATIRNWVSEIRDVAYDAEDVIEIFARKVKLRKEKGLVTKLTYYPLKIVNLYKIGKEIESLQMRLKEIAASRAELDIKNLGDRMSTHGEELQRIRRDLAIAEDKDIVGFEGITKSLVAELLKEDGKRRVVSIVGMGGAGKTTLAKKVYNHADVNALFNYHAWVCVSSIYNHKETLRTIIKDLNPITTELLNTLENMQEQDLERRLYEDLQGKRYLVVLDDVWDEGAWDCLARAFPDESTSSRLLLTSRKREVAEHALSIPHESKTLGEEDSWQLFLRKALGDEADAGCPLDLEEVGREIARRCAGLPLAITVSGGLLWAKKKLKSEWEKLLSNFSTRSQSGVSAILELSYAELPPNLKICFLYLGLFPEDCVISKRKLIHMWVAEGIIQQRGGKELEETAEYYLDQLLSRNMVQVVETTIDQRIKSCRVHDLLRELAIRKAENEIFFQIHDVRDDEISAKSRYLAVHPLPQYKEHFGVSTPHLRSLIFVNFSAHKGEVSLSFKSFRKLRVLDLENVDNIDPLPKEIGGVRLLRYLCLRTWLPKTYELPHSLGCLRNLQTLDMANGDVKVSDVIWKLESLRHLYAFTLVCDVPLKIEGLRNLQTLSGIRSKDIMHNKMVTLTSLRKLGIVVDDRSDIDKLCAHLSEVGSLKTLHLYCEYPWALLPHLAGLSRLHHVTELKLSGHLRRLPPDFPPHLSRLSLSTHVFDDPDPMPVLEKLGQLSSLKMKGGYWGQQLIISRQGFPQLKFLELSWLTYLEEIKVEKAALPQLQCLRIRDCKSLRTLPEELKHISTLDWLELVKMPEEFVHRLDAETMSRVPNFRIFNS